ncbi:uncharacterized protein N7515_008003 [Penicillium bovifimosum]|uniref:Uncharacterized protein n=1 Tax=Penicillium bovifimosum TaxID=126998 RepID=A0A9W9KXF2_9EURO|nr:uncharacterized protein N7515_008003 [Penicillium bovifimosum]KAJ5124178.1 hypothetical protein N7515_008003 [Penicillium bovifimosum]
MISDRQVETSTAPGVAHVPGAVRRPRDENNVDEPCVWSIEVEAVKDSMGDVASSYADSDIKRDIAPIFSRLLAPLKTNDARHPTKLQVEHSRGSGPKLGFYP